MKIEKKKQAKEEKRLKKLAKLEEKKRIAEEKRLKKLAKNKKKRKAKKQKKIKEINLLENKNIETDSSFASMVEKIKTQNLLKPYPDLNRTP